MDFVEGAESRIIKLISTALNIDPEKDKAEEVKSTSILDGLLIATIKILQSSKAFNLTGTANSM